MFRRIRINSISTGLALLANLVLVVYPLLGGTGCGCCAAEPFASMTNVTGSPATDVTIGTCGMGRSCCGCCGSTDVSSQQAYGKACCSAEPSTAGTANAPALIAQTTWSRHVAGSECGCGNGCHCSISTDQLPTLPAVPTESHSNANVAMLIVTTMLTVPEEVDPPTFPAELRGPRFYTTAAQRCALLSRFLC